MDKQQLAQKIWTAADAMRGTIDGNDYKDAFLGLMFYKFLSDKEQDLFTREGMPAEIMSKELVAGSQAERMAKDKLGYFIEHENLYSTWARYPSRVTDKAVNEAVRAFERSYEKDYAPVFDDIFKSFKAVIEKLGKSADERADMLRKLVKIIREIPTMGRRGYDILGFVYEYLIGKFAANAGEKAGEFYTPHEVARVMAEIVAYHLEDRPTIQVYDPTSGSASLLLNIGDVVESNNGKKDSVKYYAQELKTPAYNLTRMNLFMRGVHNSNMVTNEGNSLKDDWPKEDKYGNNNPLLVDAVVSNPPYSATWDRDEAEGDPRFAYGRAPKKPADYAFVLHELYHLKDDGIMAVVLPHGTLFRKSHEETIRKALVNNYHIDAIIGFPAKIFYGTGISTLVMILKKNRETNDILFVDASQGFEKVGKENILRSRDIRKIVDVVTERREVENFSRIVSFDEIVDNGYNLNIPRYVDSSLAAETFDIYATMYGGIPQYEIDLIPGLDKLEGLRGEIFASLTETHTQLAKGLESRDDVAGVVFNHPSVVAFIDNYTKAIQGFEETVFETVFESAETLVRAKTEEQLRNDLFSRVAGIDVVDPYATYEIFARAWNQIDNDLDIIQADTWAAAREIETLMKPDPQGEEGDEIPAGYEGKLVAFDLVRRVLFADQMAQLDVALDDVSEIEGQLTSLFESMDDESKKEYAGKKGGGFAKGVVEAEVKRLRAEVTTPEIRALEAYLQVETKQRGEFMAAHEEVEWSSIDSTARGIAKLPSVRSRIKALRLGHEFDEGSVERTLMDAWKLLEERTAANGVARDLKKAIEGNLQSTIENLSDDELRTLMRHKWIDALTAGLAQYPLDLLNDLVSGVVYLDSKYAVTLGEVGQKIATSGKTVANLLDQMSGSEKDMAGIAALSDLIGGDK